MDNNRAMLLARCGLVAVLLLMGSFADSVWAQSLTLVDVPFTPQALTLIYDPNDGNLSANGGGELISVFELVAAEEVLAYEHLAPACRSIFDIASNKIFILETAGVTDFDCGPVLPKQLSAGELIADLSVRGSFLPSGGLDQYVSTSPHLYVVPEPNSFVMLLCGVLCLHDYRRAFSTLHWQETKTFGLVRIKPMPKSNA